MHFLISLIPLFLRREATTNGVNTFPRTFILVLRAYLELLLFDLYLGHGSFSKLHNKVRTYPCRKHTFPPGEEARICAAVDMAAIWYWKQILCLQRSVATTRLLRQRGFPAEMIIGTHLMPFKAHAWVEVGGRVVSDKPYMHEIYQPLDRC